MRIEKKVLYKRRRRGMYEGKVRPITVAGVEKIAHVDTTASLGFVLRAVAHHKALFDAVKLALNRDSHPQDEEANVYISWGNLKEALSHRENYRGF